MDCAALYEENGIYFLVHIHTTRSLSKVVVQVTFKKSAIIAYFGGGEQEIIVIPKKDGDLKDMGVVEGNL